MILFIMIMTLITVTITIFTIMIMILIIIIMIRPLSPYLPLPAWPPLPPPTRWEQNVLKTIFHSLPTNISLLARKHFIILLKIFHWLPTNISLIAKKYFIVWQKIFHCLPKNISSSAKNISLFTKIMWQKETRCAILKIWKVERTSCSITELLNCQNEINRKLNSS